MAVKNGKLVIKQPDGMIGIDVSNIEYELVRDVATQMAQKMDAEIMKSAHTLITAEGNILDPEALNKAVKEMSCKRCGKWHVDGALYQCATCDAVLCAEQIISYPKNVAEDRYAHPMWAVGAHAEYECGPCHVFRPALTDKEVLAKGFPKPIKKGGPYEGAEEFKKFAFHSEEIKMDLAKQSMTITGRAYPPVSNIVPLDKAVQPDSVFFFPAKTE